MHSRASQVALLVKNMLVNAGDTRDVHLIPGQEVSLVEGIVIHSSILVWRILWTEEPGGLLSIGLHSQT